jgi:diguanylate cyclase (GGDEF)-like protein
VVNLVNIEPFELGNRIVKWILGVIILIIIGIIGTSIPLSYVIEFFYPDGQLLNWHLVILSTISLVLLTVYLMYVPLKKEYEAHQTTIKDRDNLKEALGNSEKYRLTDVITGIPNSEGLKFDINSGFSKNNEEMQLIFIDLKNFRQININFGYLKADDLLRHIAQTIYKRMRRNEEMYKGPIDDPKSNMYRVYSGGDEFVFVIFGDQAEAIGFANRLVGIFQQISTSNILGTEIELSFTCAIVKIFKRDSFSDIFERVMPCFATAKDGIKKFTICWFPDDIEKTLTNKKEQLEIDNTKLQIEIDNNSKQDGSDSSNLQTEIDNNKKKIETYKRKLSEYGRAKILFQVMTRKNYHEG